MSASSLVNYIYTKSRLLRGNFLCSCKSTERKLKITWFLLDFQYFCFFTFLLASRIHSPSLRFRIVRYKYLRTAFKRTRRHVYNNIGTPKIPLVNNSPIPIQRTNAAIVVREYRSSHSRRTGSLTVFLLFARRNLWPTHPPPSISATHKILLLFQRDSGWIHIIILVHKRRTTFTLPTLRCLWTKIFNGLFIFLLFFNRRTVDRNQEIWRTASKTIELRDNSAPFLPFLWGFLSLKV